MKQEIVKITVDSTFFNPMILKQWLARGWLADLIRCLPLALRERIINKWFSHYYIYRLEFMCSQSESLSHVNDMYNGMMLIWTSGPLQAGFNTIIDYTWSPEGGHFKLYALGVKDKVPRNGDKAVIAITKYGSENEI